jgi:hypothetical protein
MRRRGPIPTGKIEKPEDKAWREWFDSLGKEEHEQHLAQLGLDKEEIEEWEELEGFKKRLPRKK